MMHDKKKHEMWIAQLPENKTEKLNVENEK